jgi:hypothetical protein
MEEHRRTDEGRVRTAKEFVGHFFPHDAAKADDRLFVRMPNEVRGPVLARWGIRGAKAALKDDDARVKLVVHDALLAGDLDDASFEEGMAAAVLVEWVALPAWWSFWRTGRLTPAAIQKALATARDLGLFDDAWFLRTMEGRGGKLKGTDALCDTLSKDQLIAWVRKVHESKDASPAGLVAAIGWDTVLARTAQDALLFTLDRLADKAGLTAEAENEPSDNAEPQAETSTERPTLQPRADDTPTDDGASAAAETAGAVPTPPSARGDAPRSQEPATARHDKLAEIHPTVSAPGAVSAGDAAGSGKALPVPPDSGFPIAIPELPAIDGGDDGDEDEPTSVGERSSWTGTEESPKLAEARAAIMHTLRTTPSLVVSEVPPPQSEPLAKPSSLDWSAPPSSNGVPDHSGDEPISLQDEDLQKASLPRLRASVPPPVPKKPPAPRGG